MTLKEQLDALIAKTEKQASAQALEVMHRATAALKNSDIMDGVVKAGDTIPHFTLKNAEGTPVRSQDILKHGPMVLIFYRGGWWPYCNLELDALQQAVGPITDLGATLVAVSPQMERFNREFIQKHRLTFDILSDPGNQVAKTFGLVHELPEDLRKVYRSFGIDLEKFNADGLWRLPMPARYVIDRNSVVRSADVNPDYTVRPEPNETVEFLRKMIKPS